MGKTMTWWSIWRFVYFYRSNGVAQMHQCPKLMSRTYTYTDIRINLFGHISDFKHSIHRETNLLDTFIYRPLLCSYTNPLENWQWKKQFPFINWMNKRKRSTWIWILNLPLTFFCCFFFISIFISILCLEIEN